MTEKRFDIDDSDMVIDDLLTGESYIFDSEGDCNACYDLLNELHEENQHIKKAIKESYEHERTAMGKAVLKQLAEALEVKL